MAKFLVVLILGMALLAWCPWFKAEEALRVVDIRVAELRRDNPDLCALIVNKKSITKVPFGYTEEVSYDCTINDELYGVLKSHNTVFITFYKSLIGMPQKNIRNNI